MDASTATQPVLGLQPGGAETAPRIAPRKFKASELPLSSAVRETIDSLTQSFKKEGAYDTIRKDVWEKFQASVGCSCHTDGEAHC